MDPMAQTLASELERRPSGPTAALTGGPPTHHLVDVTMFWSATGGGVRRYLMRKRALLLGQSAWRQTIVAPGAAGAGMIDCGGLPLPLSGGYRLPLRRAHAAVLIADQHPDLIEAGDPYRLAWAALDAAQRLSVPTIAFCHSNLAAMAARLAGGRGFAARSARRAGQAYLRRVYQAFDRVYAPSAAMAGELRQIGLTHVEQQPLGVDSLVFHPDRRDPALRDAWRQKLGLAPDARLLLYAGRFAPEKNLPLLVEAVERLGAPYYLLAIGAGPTPPRGMRVRVLDYEASEARLAKIYASVDGFVHAGDQETFGLSALEAMASGTPIAVCAAAGLVELVAGGAGLPVAPSTPEAWASAMAALFDDERETRIRLARLHAESLDWRLTLPALLRRYQALVGETPAKPFASQPAPGLFSA